MAQGFIFDFNGTLYFDHDLNYRAWKQMFFQLTDNRFDFEHEYQAMVGLPNRNTLIHILDLCGKAYTEEDLKTYSLQKEAIYQSLGLKEHRTVLPDGAKEFLNSLKEHQKILNLATCSIASNVDFYFNHFGLEQWFDKSLITYDDGVMDVTNKAYMFFYASQRMRCSIEDCIVVEDSPKAIEEAKQVHCKGVLYINSRNIPLSDPYILQSVKDYRDIDTNLFI